MDMIRDYRILRELPATTGKVYLAERRGRRYAIKEYYGCRFPVDEGEPCPASLRGAQERAVRYMERLQAIAAHLRAHFREDGLISVPTEVFRHGRMICKVTRLIDDCGLPPEALHAQLSDAQMNVLLKTILLQLDMLGDAGFVHGDVKPGNVIVSRRGSIYTGSLIDYDTGFTPGQCPDRVDYTPEYAAPEMLWLHAVMAASPSGEELRGAFARVGVAADVYAMGCVFAHLLTGQPWMGADAAGCPEPPGRLMLEGTPLPLPEMHPVWRSFLRRMTAADPAMRATPRQVIGGVNACITSGVYDEMKDPWAGFALLPDSPLLGGKVRLAEHRGQRVLLRHMEDCWRIPMRFSWRPPAVQQLRRTHSQKLKRLERLSRRVRELSGKIGLLRPFRVLHRGRRVFTALPLSGGSLHPLTALHEMTAPEEADALMAGLLEDMQRLHDAGLLHGAPDMASIAVLCPEGGRPQLILTDPHHLCTQQELGSGVLPEAGPELLSPELARLHTAPDAQVRGDVLALMGSRSDVFSLGLLLHAAFAGELPRITGGACPSLAAAAGEGAIALHPSLSPARAELLRDMLVYEPDDRLQSCTDAALRLRVLSAAEEAAAEPVLLIWQEESGALLGQDLPAAFLDAGDELLAFPAEAPGDEVPAGLIGDLDKVCDVPDYGELPSGFLRRLVIRREDGVALLARPLLLRMETMQEHSSWFEERRGEWNRFAAAVGMLPVCGIYQHGGVPYGLSPLPDAWGTLADVDHAACSPPQVRRWIAALLEQLAVLHRHGMSCPLISPGEVLLTDCGGVQVHLHAFDHFQRAGRPEDGRRWVQLLREHCLPQDQAMACLAPEAWENVFGGATNVLSPAADIFSVGALMHVMLTGRSPARAEDDRCGVFARGTAVVDAKIDFPLRWLIMRMLRVDPADRIADCDEALRLLEQIGREEGRVRSVTVRAGGEPLTGSTVQLYAVADDCEHCVAAAKVGPNGRAVFRGYMPSGFVYEVRCGDWRRTCRWRLTEPGAQK